MDPGKQKDNMLSRFETKNGRNPAKIGLTLFAFITYTILFFLLDHYSGEKVSALSILPVITLSLFFGIRTGLLGTVLIIAVNTAYLHLSGESSPHILIENIPGELGTIVISFALGYLHDLYYKYKDQYKIIEKEISERKKAEARLFEIQNMLGMGGIAPGFFKQSADHSDFNFQQKIYREIADNASDIIYTVDLRGYFTYVNKYACRSAGFTLEELLKMKYTDLVVTDYKERAIHFYLRQYLNKELNTYFEFPFKTRNGGVKWYGQNCALITENGKITGFSFIGRDITERKRMADEIRKREEILHSITYLANDAIISIDSEFNIIQCNKAAERMYGYSEEEMLGQSLALIVPPDERDGLAKLMQKKDPTEGLDTTRPFVRNGYRKDGTVFPVEISIAQWLNNNKRHFTHIIRDVTERKEIEQKIRNSEKEYRDLFNNAHEPILIIHPEGEIILEANDRACKTYGYDYKEFIGMSLKDISKDPQKGSEKVTETLKKGYFINFETVQYNKQGKELFFDVNASLTDYKGEKVILSLNRDITERVLAERELEVYREHLERLVEERTAKLAEVNERLQKALEAEKKLSALRARFVSTASHEFRTPLTTIQASSELLLRYFSRWDDAKKITTISRVQKSAEYMNGLIESVLTLNRSDSGRVMFNPGEVEIVSLCGSIIEEISLLASPGHKIEFDFPEYEIRGLFDGLLIRQFLTNLLSNAVKYSPSGGLIKLKVSRDQETVIFEVSDKGIGISEDDQQNLFEPFFRGTNISNIPGTGLGLSILKKAVELHRGRLEFQSKINSGTTFRVFLPAA